MKLFLRPLVCGSHLCGCVYCGYNFASVYESAWGPSHLQRDADLVSCPRCEWQFYGILRGFRHEEPVPVDDRDAELASCPRCRQQFYGILRGFRHEEQVPGDDRDAERLASCPPCR